MVLTTSDRERLVSLLRSGATPAMNGEARARLNAGIVSARLVEPPEVPPTVVTMNSIVSLIDIDSGEIAKYSLVYPADANVDRLKISVMAPLGAALIGRSEGDIIEVAVPSGTKRFFLQKVLFQPESRFRSPSASIPAA